MLGWRGASRYYDEKYKSGFKLECEAIKKVREEWGLKNVVVMVPFCRTVEEGKKVLKTMKEFGLERGKNGLQVYVMCEIPSNVILAKEFSQIFDGFSIGSNDLTQLTLGVDRDSALVSHVYDEKNEAVKTLIRQVIKTAHEYKRKVGICGQAPSDYPEFAEFLVQEGIDSISLNPDTVLKTRERIAAMEKKVAVKPAGFKVSVATKMLLIFGVMGLISVLSGYACQTIGNEQVLREQARINMENEVAKAKSQLKRELEQKFAEEQAKQKSTYSEDSFVKFTLEYPSSWTVSHLKNLVSFSDGSSDLGLYFIISKKDYSDRLRGEPISTSTWKGYPVKTFVIKPSGDSDSLGQKVVELYPDGYRKSIYILVIEGSLAEFDEIAATFKDFAIKK